MTNCSYCGREARCTADHVVPRCLYPPSRSKSRVQRLTVPACRECNAGWADDEAHFRNIMTIAGEPNAAVTELWQRKALRSFSKRDGKRRLSDVWSQLVPVVVDGKPRHKVYPAKDLRVMRVIRKVIRGLSHHHNLLSSVSDDQVWADLLSWQVPQAILHGMQPHDREEDIFSYRYAHFDFDRDLSGIDSGWVLTFFGRTTFVGAVLNSADGSR